MEYSICKDARDGNTEEIVESVKLENSQIYLKVIMDTEGKCKFSYSTDNKNFIEMEKSFTAREGRWIGAKVGLFVVSNSDYPNMGFADFDWFRFEE